MRPVDDEICDFLYTMPDYYDGPLRGVASFEGKPVLYEAAWNVEEAGGGVDVYDLYPISDDLFALALEDWELWLRWDRAFFEGRTTRETHPVLPEDRARAAEIEATLKARLVADPSRAVRARVTWAPAEPSPRSGEREWTPIKVRWSRL